MSSDSWKVWSTCHHCVWWYPEYEIRGAIRHLSLFDLSGPLVFVCQQGVSRVSARLYFVCFGCACWASLSLLHAPSMYRNTEAAPRSGAVAASRVAFSNATQACMGIACACLEILYSVVCICSPNVIACRWVGGVLVGEGRWVKSFRCRCTNRST